MRIELTIGLNLQRYSRSDVGVKTILLRLVCKVAALLDI
jgi:hypothetical protein